MCVFSQGSYLGFVLTVPSGVGPGHCILTSKIVTSSELLFPIPASLQASSAFPVVAFECAHIPVRELRLNQKFQLAVLEDFVLVSRATVAVIAGCSAVRGALGASGTPRAALSSLLSWKTGVKGIPR